MRKVVIGDIHGDGANLDTLLELTGATVVGVKDPNVEVTQIGDFVHLGHGEKEADFFRRWFSYIDIHIIGNHEYPVMNPSCWFQGWHHRCQETEELVRESLSEWKLAHSIGDWLITHAGLTPGWYDEEFSDRDGAFEIAEAINNTPPKAAVIGAVGRARGGMHQEGGILWCDYYNELIPSMVDRHPCKQIVGHTPDREKNVAFWPDKEDPFIIKVDVGAKLSGNVCAVYTDNEGETWTPVVV